MNFKVILTTKPQNNCPGHVIPCPCVPARLISDPLCQTPASSSQQPVDLGLSGGEVGEQLPEPEVLGVAKVQLLRRQRPRRQPPEHCHPGGGSLCHC